MVYTARRNVGGNGIPSWSGTSSSNICFNCFMQIIMNSVICRVTMNRAERIFLV